jgi:hypothetical protein
MVVRAMVVRADGGDGDGGEIVVRAMAVRWW